MSLTAATRHVLRLDYSVQPGPYWRFQGRPVQAATAGSSGRAFANLSAGGRQNVPPVAKALGAAADRKVAIAADPAKDQPVRAIEQAYICANPTIDGNLDVYDLRYTFMHEIDHAIGLDHPGSSGSIMGYRYDERVPE